MAYPYCGDLEVTLIAAESSPKLSGLALPPDLLHRPPMPYDELGTVHQLILDQLFNGKDQSFLTPPAGTVNSYHRLRRLPRLEEGEYEVYLPGERFEISGKQFVVPETTLRISHRRAYHPVARFDKSLLSLPDPQRWGDLKLSEDIEKLGQLESVVNLEFWDRHYSTTFSDFFISFETPPEWDKVFDDYAQFKENSLAPYIHARNSKVQDALNRNSATNSLIAAIKREDSEFLAANRELVTAVIYLDSFQHSRQGQALNKVIEDYRSLISVRPFTSQYLYTTHIALDHKRRLHKLTGICLPSPLTAENYHTALHLYLERSPFNEAFHAILRQKLKSKSREQKPHINEALGVLWQAYNMIDDGHYPSALVRAASAFECALKSFLVESNAITREELDSGKYSLARLTGPVFDRAVTRDTAYSGKTDKIFDRRIRKRIVTIGEPGLYPGVQTIRNLEVHTGKGRNGKPSDYYLSQIVCATYAEALSYLAEEGWKNPSSSPRLLSESMTWISPGHRLDVPIIAEKAVLDCLSKDLELALRYMQPHEIERLKKINGPQRWVMDALNNFGKPSRNHSAS